MSDSLLAIVIKKSNKNPNQVQNQNDDWSTQLDDVKDKLQNLVDAGGTSSVKIEELRLELRSAITLKAEKKEQEALQKLKEVATKIEEATNEQKKNPLVKQDENERSLAESKLAVEMIMAGLPQGADLSEITKIINEYYAKVKGESDAFGNYDTLEDVLKIEDENDRKNRLTGISDAMTAAMDRKQRLETYLKDLDWNQLSENERLQKPTQGVKESVTAEVLEERMQSLKLAQSLVMKMTDHIPESWLGRWTPNFAKRVENLQLSKDEKAKKLKLELEIISQSTSYSDGWTGNSQISFSGYTGTDADTYTFKVGTAGTVGVDDLQISWESEKSTKGTLKTTKGTHEYDVGNFGLKIHFTTGDLVQNQTFSVTLAAATEKAEDLEAFRGFVEEGSTRTVERSDFFFDVFVKPPSTDQAKKIAVVQQKLLDRARRIRDLGGTLRDCEEVFAHIPRQWWPAEFLEEQQAWRKTERAMQRERIAKMFEESGEPGTPMECAQFLMDLFGRSAEGSDIGQKVEKFTHGKVGQDGATELDKSNWAHDEQIAMQFANYAGLSKEIFGQIRGWYEFYQGGNFAKLKEMNPKVIEEFARKLTEGANTLVKTVSSIGKTKGFPVPPEGEFIKKVIPGLAIVATGIDLLLAIESLISHAVTTHQTRAMTGDARVRWARGQDEDGGVFLSTLQNEIGARSRQLAQDSTKVLTTGAEFAGSVMETTGVGAVFGLAVKVVGKGIEYGGKLVFTSINWGLAANAKKLLKEAQAGNPIARVQIFEDCGTYAKMYIAILVLEGHPLAEKFIAQRGIEESDLDEGMSLKILREAMLQSADQKDELEFDAAEEYANIVGAGVLVKGGRFLAEKAKNVKKHVQNKDRPKTGTYNPATSITVDITNIGDFKLLSAKWQEAKEEAQKNFLFMESTGIGEALKSVHSCKGEYDKHDAIKEKQKKGKAGLAYYDAILEAHGIVSRYTPVTYPLGENEEVELHEPLVKWLVLLTKKLEETLRNVDTEVLVTKNRENFNIATSVSLESKAWSTVLKDAVEKVHMSKDDCGVDNALRDLEKAILDKDYNPNAKDKQRLRVARLTARDRYQEVIKAMKAYWIECGTCQALRDWLTAAITEAANKLKVLDKELFETPNYKVDHEYSLDGWNKAWTAACDDGYAIKKAGDGGIAKAFPDVETRATEYNDAFTSNKELTTATGNALKELQLAAFRVRRKYQKALSLLFQNISRFVGAQKELVKPLNDYCIYLRSETTKRLSALDKDQIETKVENLDNILRDPKREYTGTAWSKFYDEALANGAVPFDGGAKKLVDALDDFWKLATQSVDTKAKGSDRRKAATKATKAYGDFAQALILCQGSYAHPTVQKYLGELETKVKETKNSIDEFLGGKNSAKTFVFKWSANDWQTQKATAVAEGLIDDSKTGLGELLTKSDKAYNTVTTATSPSEKEKQAAKELLTQIKNLVAGLKANTKCPGLETYFENFVTEADIRLQKIPK